MVFFVLIHKSIIHKSVGLFSLIHKSVENDMDRRAYLWRDLDLRFVSFYESKYIAEKMDCTHKWMQALHKTPPKDAINGNMYSINFY